MGEIIKKSPNDQEKYDPVGGAGEYTQEELVNFDINNFVDFDKLNQEIRQLQIPANKDRLRITIAITINNVSGDKKTKYKIVGDRIRMLKEGEKGV